VPEYDPEWVKDAQKVKQFQQKLADAGWLDADLLEAAGETGVMGDVTYQAIYDVQMYYNENVSPSTGIVLTPVMDDNGSFTDDQGEYYLIDEETYKYIMEKLATKP